jgi:hypothetical protein
MSYHASFFSNEEFTLIRVGMRKNPERTWHRILAAFASAKAGVSRQRRQELDGELGKLRLELQMADAVENGAMTAQDYHAETATISARMKRDRMAEYERKKKAHRQQSQPTGAPVKRSLDRSQWVEITK